MYSYPSRACTDTCAALRKLLMIQVGSPTGCSVHKGEISIKEKNHEKKPPENGKGGISGGDARASKAAASGLGRSIDASSSIASASSHLGRAPVHGQLRSVTAMALRIQAKSVGVSSLNPFPFPFLLHVCLARLKRRRALTKLCAEQAAQASPSASVRRRAFT